MNTKLIDINGYYIARLKKTSDQRVCLEIILPPVSIETEYGLTSAPAEYVCIFGSEQLLKLSTAIRDFCEEQGGDK